MSRAWQFIKTVIGIIFRHPVTGTTLIPILPDGQIVLVRRRDTGQWSLPGGIIDWGEDLATAARRELSEETGLTLQRICRLVGVYSSPERDPRIHSISILIEVEAEGTLTIQDTGEISEVKGFALNNLPKERLSHDHDRQLQDYLQGLTVVA